MMSDKQTEVPIQMDQMLRGTRHYSKVKTCCPSQPQWNISDTNPKSTRGFGLVPEIQRDAFCVGDQTDHCLGGLFISEDAVTKCPVRGFSLPVFCVAFGPIYFYIAVSESIWKSKLDHVTVLPKNLHWLHRAHKVKSELLPCPARPCRIWLLLSLQAMHTLTHYTKSAGQPLSTPGPSHRLPPLSE